MKSPERILDWPIYAKEGYLIRSAKVGALSSPKMAALDLDDVFGGRSLCLIDYVPAINGGEFDVPTFLVLLVKKGAPSTAEGWVCEYDGRAKVSLLNDEDIAPLKDEPKRHYETQSTPRNPIR